MMFTPTRLFRRTRTVVAVIPGIWAAACGPAATGTPAAHLPDDTGFELVTSTSFVNRAPEYEARVTRSDGDVSIVSVDTVLNVYVGDNCRSSVHMSSRQMWANDILAPSLYFEGPPAPESTASLPPYAASLDQVDEALSGNSLHTDHVDAEQNLWRRFFHAAELTVLSWDAGGATMRLEGPDLAVCVWGPVPDLCDEVIALEWVDFEIYPIEEDAAPYPTLPGPGCFTGAEPDPFGSGLCAAVAGAHTVFVPECPVKLPSW